ncbi:unannotated protein [freshwater metagenome]|uniref:Unannotated protein n=1 Tax=freshwater metagenome TaxID=449393 RepID=A0A6J5Z3R0_9ZZZZ|nr:DUF541 domain-containing protein [Actinomycetota bacterium]
MNTSTIKKSILVAIPVLLVAAIINPMSADAATTPRHITVNAEGTVKVTPDAVRINATATSIALTNKLALSQVATTATALRAALKTSGIAVKDIATQSVTAYPEYNYTNDKGAVLVGYRATQSFTIVVRNASNAGAVVDAIVAAGGDSLQVNGVSPFVLDASKATEAARAAAVKNAKAKATSYAKLLGVKLGRVDFLTETSSPSISRPEYVASSKEMSADATVIDLGEQDVTVTITIRWSL